MKLVLIPICAALAVTVGACSHADHASSRLSTPVASLTEAEIRAELAAVSRELDLVGAWTRESLERENSQRRMAMLASRHSDSSVVAPLEPQMIPVTPPYVKIERLRKRQDQLRAQLTKMTRPLT